MYAPDETLPAYLYRHYDASGTLLYVGVSLSAAERLQTHMRWSPWARVIATITVQPFDDKGDALEAEKRAIVLERPLWNTVLNHGSQRRRRRPAKRALALAEHQAALGL